MRMRVLNYKFPVLTLTINLVNISRIRWRGGEIIRLDLDTLSYLTPQLGTEIVLS